MGVEHDGTVTGAHPRHDKTTDLDRVTAPIAARTRPALAVRVEEHLLDGMSVLLVEVPRQQHVEHE